MLKCIPAIQPISNKDLRKTASGYGTRIDPIYGTTKFHAGMDFSAHPGTDVYATGDGTVVKMGWETGYGNTVEIDHASDIVPATPIYRSFVLNWVKRSCVVKL